MIVHARSRISRLNNVVAGVGADTILTGIVVLMNVRASGNFKTSSALGRNTVLLGCMVAFYVFWLQLRQVYTQYVLYLCRVSVPYLIEIAFALCRKNGGYRMGWVWH